MNHKLQSSLTRDKRLKVQGINIPFTSWFMYGFSLTSIGNGWEGRVVMMGGGIFDGGCRKGGMEIEVARRVSKQRHCDSWDVRQRGHVATNEVGGRAEMGIIKLWNVNN